MCNISIAFLWNDNVFLSTNRFREPQSHQPHIRSSIYHSIRRMYESFLGISTVFFRTDSIIRIFFITTLST